MSAETTEFRQFRLPRILRPGELIARIRCPIQLKLLAAFLTIACLMGGVSLLGVSTLRQANERISELVIVQDRVAKLNVFRGSLAELKIRAVATSVPPGSKIESLFTSATFSNELAYLPTISEAAIRAFNNGAATSLDQVKLVSGFRQKTNELRELGREFERILIAQGDSAARDFFEDYLLPKVQSYDRELYTLGAELNRDMEQRAREAQKAYETSQKLMLTAAALTIGMSLLLGYALSSSILRPTETIRAMLRRVSRGDFDARVAVANKDELGDLADGVNTMARRLGTLYGWNASSD